ncbi:MAG: hypothetical protein ACOZQL_24205 [Myxococcota bacterium]
MKRAHLQLVAGVAFLALFLWLAATADTPSRSAIAMHAAWLGSIVAIFVFTRAEPDDR